MQKSHAAIVRGAAAQTDNYALCTGCSGGFYQLARAERTCRHYIALPLRDKCQPACASQLDIRRFGSKIENIFGIRLPAARCGNGIVQHLTAEQRAHTDTKTLAPVGGRERGYIRDTRARKPARGGKAGIR